MGLSHGVPSLESNDVITVSCSDPEGNIENSINLARVGFSGKKGAKIRLSSGVPNARVNGTLAPRPSEGSPCYAPQTSFRLTNLPVRPGPFKSRAVFPVFAE